MPAQITGIAVVRQGIASNPGPLALLNPNGTAFTIPADAQAASIHGTWWANSSNKFLTSVTSTFSENFVIAQLPSFATGNGGNGPFVGMARVTSTGAGKTLTPVWEWNTDAGPPFVILFWKNIPPTGPWYRPTGNSGADPRVWQISTSNGVGTATGVIPSSSTDVVVATDQVDGNTPPSNAADWTSIVTEALNGHAIRVRAANTAGATTTTTTTQGTGGVWPTLSMLSVISDESPGPSLPSFSAHPTNATVIAPATAGFSATVSGATSLQWQVSTNGGSSWANVSGGTGGTTASYTTAATTTGMSGYQYRLAATNADGTSYSNAAVLTVNAAGTPPSVTTHPTNQTASAGSTATFNSAFSGASSYQWQVNKNIDANILGVVPLYFGTPAAPGARTLNVPAGATAVVGFGMTLSTTGVSSVVKVDADFVSGGSLNVTSDNGATATASLQVYRGTVTATGAGRTLTPEFNRTLEAGAAIVLVFLKDVNPADLIVTPVFARAPNESSPATATINAAVGQTILAFNATGGSIGGTPPTNWSREFSGNYTELVTVSMVIDKRSGTGANVSYAGATTGAVGDAVIALAIKRAGFQNVTDGAGGTTVSYTTPATVIGMSGYQYRNVGTNANGSTNTNPATLTVTDVPVDAPDITSVTNTAAGQTVTVSGTFTGGTPTSIAVTLPAAGTPNGAVTQGPTNATIGSGTFTVTFTDVPLGSYSAPTALATNSGGSDTGSGSPFEILSIDGDPNAPGSTELVSSTSEAVTSADSSARSLAATKTRTESGAASDSQSVSSLSATRQATETLAANDQRNAVKGIQLSGADSVVSTDATDRTSVAAKSQTETLNSVDQSSPDSSKIGSQTETLVVSENTDADAQRARGVAESGVAVDGNDRTLTASKAQTDSGAVGASEDRSLSAQKAQSESIPITDSVSQDTTSDAHSTDLLNTTEFSDNQKTLSKSITESTTSVDSLSASLASDPIQQETLVVSDAVNGGVSSPTGVNDTLYTTADAEATASSAKTQTDNILSLDYGTAEKHVFKDQQEISNTVDTLNRSTSSTASQTDTATPVDQALSSTTSTPIAVSQLDSGNAVAAQSKLLTASKSQQEAGLAQDSTSRGLSALASSAEISNSIDSASSTVDATFSNVNQKEILAVEDQHSVVLTGFVKTVADYVSTKDVHSRSMVADRAQQEEGELKDGAISALALVNKSHTENGTALDQSSVKLGWHTNASEMTSLIDQVGRSVSANLSVVDQLNARDFPVGTVQKFAMFTEVSGVPIDKSSAFVVTVVIGGRRRAIIT